MTASEPDFCCSDVKWEADLYGADLRGADLRWANLRGAIGVPSDVAARLTDTGVHP